VLSATLLAATPSQVVPPLPTTTSSTGTTTEPPPPTTTTTTTTTAPRPSTIAAGVTVGGDLLVGGLSPAAATSAVKSFFARPLSITVEGRTVRTTPKLLGAYAFVGEAVNRARIAAPGANVPLKVTAPQARLERYVRALAKRFDRQPVDAKLRLRDSKPFVTEDKPGRRIRQVLAVRALFLSLKTHDREPIVLKPEAIPATVTRNSVGDVIVIRRGQNKLFLYDGMKLKRTFGVATGQSRYPTPLGAYEVIVKWKNPWWYPPSSDWAKDAEPIPPGPGNPLGTRWMGISSPAVGIHGTPDPASIGYSVSHGCIRMRIPEVEWLFNQVEVGTPVYILR
jgi:lipoprotein-anchoring transpeptidase ErfK/SrfK